MMKKYLILLKNIPNSRLECTNHTLFQTKMVEIDTLFQTKTAEKPLIPFGAAHSHITYTREYPPPSPPGAENALQLMSLAAYASETNNAHYTYSQGTEVFVTFNMAAFVYILRALVLTPFAANLTLKSP